MEEYLDYITCSHLLVDVLMSLGSFLPPVFVV